ncbi:egg cell-secreted protein 1.4-like [Cynara cardunculus var. scolymus]|uniref:Prolamin-like domain-containing protein n=1 Tax=Cynara cardunculus var. scolymus TaxID=59895 RepID=A0A124SCG8_CYNCS|nr:egg cell-secreted protein 1.4-like [Cynara cardunculus var. scolymus]KVH93762.1 Prolamin-like domain-containing protein [Cynara cardunculus var. scolymus]
MNTGMAWSSRVLFVILCLASFTSQGLSQGPSSISQKASIMQCWSALFDLGFCYGDLSRAARTGRVDVSIGPTCCKAATSMNSGCWPKIFPFNPFFPPILQIICSNYPSVTLDGPTSAPYVVGLLADAPSN